MTTMSKYCLILTLLLCPSLAFCQNDIPSRIGAGNFGTGTGGNTNARFKILQTINAGMCRVTVSENEYFDRNKTSHPERFDDLMLIAHRHHITPMLLFEYYTRWNGPLGGHDKWHSVGKAFATRFAPNSPFLRSRGIADWGVTFYSAINEPMWTANNPTPIDPAEYAKALEGLADGVHSVDKKLHVSPGGFQEIPLLRTNPFGPAIAHLYNNGKLSAIDIHRYYDVQYQPMYGTYQNSLQNQFDQVKAKWNITADILFYTTEFNFKKRLVDETQAASGFLTAIWDALGIVGNNGRPVTQFALPWNIFNTPERDDHYGMTIDLDPWKPTRRGQVLRMIGQLTDDMYFTKLDPRKTGTFVLEGDRRKIYVWQNRKGWTDKPGTQYTIPDIPSFARKLRIYAFDGPKKTIPLAKQQKTCTLTDLAPEQTYIFLLTP